MLVSDAERTHTCYVFTCMQLASTVGGPQSAHRSGNFAMTFYHGWIRAFLVFANAPRHHIFPPYTTIEESLLYSLLVKVGAAKITAMLCQDVCVLASGSRGSVVITRYQSLPLSPRESPPHSVTQ